MNFNTMPSEILEKKPHDKWNLLKREDGPDEGVILVMFKCKTECQTIFSLDHIDEMNRYVATMVDLPNWPYICLR